MNQQKRVFISYAREDRKFCLKLAEALSSYGYSIWIDIISIKAGTDWAKTIEEALANTDYVIAVHSLECLNRSYQAKGEWIHAKDLGKRIIPIIVNGVTTVHKDLSHLHAIKFTGLKNFQMPLDKLLSAMQGEPEIKMEPDEHFAFYKGEEPVYYPDFFDERSASLVSILAPANDICCIAATGHRFLSRHIWKLEEKMADGAKFRLILSYPNQENLLTVSEWSAKPLGEEYQRLKDNIKRTANFIERLAEYASKGTMELHLLQFNAPFSTIQINRDEPDGTIVLGHYYVDSLTTKHKFIRPSTLLTNQIYPDLYNHCKFSFDSAWIISKSVTLLDYLSIVAAL